MACLNFLHSDAHHVFARLSFKIWNSDNSSMPVRTQSQQPENGKIPMPTSPTGECKLERKMLKPVSSPANIEKINKSNSVNAFR